MRIFCKNLNLKWKKNNRKLKTFRSKNSSWLCSSQKFDKKKDNREHAGRPRLSFSDKSVRGKRRDASELSQSTSHQSDLLVLAASTAARKKGDFDLAAILKKTVESPSRPSKIRKSLENNLKSPIRLTPAEALAFLLEHNFTKDQYCAIRNESKVRNCDIYPHYNEVAAEKLKCRPQAIELSEKFAKASLESVLLHTVTRIVEMQTDVLETVMAQKNVNSINADFILSYGFDCSSGHAQYKQVFSNPSISNNTDSSLLATTLIPLRLLLSSEIPLWNNPTPQSVRFCRPLKLEYINETKEVIIKEELELRNQINTLKEVVINIDGDKTIVIKFKLYLTLIDGKVLNVLTGTKSSLCCPICGASSTSFRSITDYKSEIFRAKECSLKYGISPLHCWLRFFEYVLHAGYKCEVKKWQIREQNDKVEVAKRRKEIQKQFWEKLGLRVDMPKVGGCGNTNDGNTARRAFENHKLFSEITGIDENLVFRLKIILISLACQFPLNIEKFEIFCFETADIIMTKYPWLPMKPTVHKVLIHSRQIIENTVLPVGYFGEDAAESRHKIYKADRLHHARKSSRIKNIQDIFNRSMDTSDPLISSTYIKKRLQHRKRLQLPKEVIDLLQEVELEENTTNITDAEDVDENILCASYIDYLDNIELESE